MTCEKNTVPKREKVENIYERGEVTQVVVDSSWGRKPDQEDGLLDDGKPVRFYPETDVSGEIVKLKAVYSFMRQYAEAPIEEGRDIARMENMRRIKVRPKVHPLT